MAHWITLDSPPPEFALNPSVLTVTRHVGPSKPNEGNDVLLVQYLLYLGNLGQPPGLPRPSPTGIFDLSTAYWIWHTQNLCGNLSRASPDGIVSPVAPPGVRHTPWFYAPGRVHFIVLLNYRARTMHGTRYSEMIARHFQDIVPGL